MAAARTAAATAAGTSTFLPNGRYRNPIPFGGRPSPLRLFGNGLGDQAGWMLPFALFGLIALARLASWRCAGAAGPSRMRPPSGTTTPRADGELPATPQAAAAGSPSPDGATRGWPRVLVLGGWFLGRRRSC